MLIFHLKSDFLSEIESRLRKLGDWSFFYTLGGAEGGAEQGGAELGEGGGGGGEPVPFKIIFACILLLELSKGNAIVFFIMHQLYL